MTSRLPRRQPASTWLPLSLVTTGQAHVQFANRGSALPRMGSLPSEPALKGTGVSGDRLGYVLSGRWPTGHPFLCHAGLGSAEETQDRKRSSSPCSRVVSTKIVFLYYYFINLDFFWGDGGGVEHQGHTRDITSLVLFEWLQGLWPSVPTSGWSHLVSFFWILGIGEHPSVTHTITSTLKQMTVTQGMLTFKESSNRQQANDSWLCPVHSLKAASKLITKYSIKNVTTFYVKTMEKIELSQKRSVLTTENKKKEKKKHTSKS